VRRPFGIARVANSLFAHSDASVAYYGVSGEVTREMSADEPTTLEMLKRRQHIADYLGITVETVNRTFTILKPSSHRPRRDHRRSSFLLFARSASSLKAS